MPLTMNEVLIPSLANQNQDFPNAPLGWTLQEAKHVAAQQGLILSKDHLKAVRAIQEYFSLHQDKRQQVRGIHDALNESFHQQGGIKFLYKLFPGGPVAQGYLIAGVEPPAGAANNSFGSVQ
ncbi:MAG: TusE/DsrC/DsvC family sulfur relay protein [Ectothiorhodospiraceae bacterium]|nr:TusE/DsrC/DsvC family sulfur relay protein [Ectothiorhodospiraceae bacterium]